jgi:hypothetical protein
MGGRTPLREVTKRKSFDSGRVRLILPLLHGVSKVRSGANQLFDRLGALFMSESQTRSLKLLREWLSPDQLTQFEAWRYFDVVGSDTGKLYRIHYGSPMNIDELDDRGRPSANFCLEAQITVSPFDLMLAQKIALEADETNALSVARKYPPGMRLVMSDYPFC